jgi:hypothetical protein
MALCESLSVHTRSAGVCTSLRQNETLESRRPIDGFHRNDDSSTGPRDERPPHIKRDTSTDATTGAKHPPPRQLIRSVVSANLKLPPQALYDRGEEYNTSNAMRRRVSRFHTTQPPHLQAPR